MPIDEKLFPLAEAIKQATGYRPHTKTAVKWAQKATREGVRLEAQILGGRWFTSAEAVRRYMAEKTAARDHASRRRKAISKTAGRLARSAS